MKRFKSVACTVPLLIFVSIACGARAQPAGDALAQNYPSRPIRFVVPYPPGGGTDIVARELAPYLVEAWAQQVIVDNRGGAGATIGHGITAKSTPDGYTMMLGTSGGLVSSPLFGVQVNYEPLRDFEPIGMLADIPFMVAVPTALPVNNIRELIDLSKARPKGLNFASPGTGTPNHLSGELLKVRSGMRFVHVPYKGGGPAMTDLIAGEMHFIFTGVPQLLPHVRSGRLRLIASGHPVRSRLAPDAAPIADVYPGFNSSTWFCLLFPAGTSKAIAAKVNAQLNRIVTATEFGNRLLLQGAEPATSTPEQLMEKIKSETERWRKIIKDAGLAAGG
jgi:tripartite-type tricarboxylate transporter receptor subunit TctC